MPLIDYLFHHLYSNFGFASRQNHLIILKFTDETANVFPTSTLLETGIFSLDVFC